MHHIEVAVAPVRVAGEEVLEYHLVRVRVRVRLGLGLGLG